MRSKEVVLLSRTVREKRVYIKPVQKIELDESNVKLRIFAVVAMIVIAATAFGFGISMLVKGNTEWTEAECIMADSNCSGDFRFGFFATGRRMKTSVEAEYSKACVDAYAIFSAKERFADVNNLWKLNNEPNTRVVLEKELYDALWEVAESGMPYFYLGPVFNEYESLCLSESDEEAAGFDPERSAEARDFREKLLGFIGSRDDIELLFLGDNTVELLVSEEYAAFREENGKFPYIDLGWMKNAFVTDYIAGKLKESKLNIAGILDCNDGFRCYLADGEVELKDNDKENYLYHNIKEIGTGNVVLYHDKPLTDPIGDSERIRYYKYADGTVVHSYIRYPDGVPATEPGYATCSSDKMDCSQIMLETIDSYIEGEDWDTVSTDIWVVR